MAQMLNMDIKKQDDAYYRYKMPASTIKIEGSGNGIKTIVTNLHEICKVLKRPEEILLKFLGNELGALSNYSKADDKFLVMGQQTNERIQELIFRFIDKYILCSMCRNPETDVIVGAGKNAKIHLECRACSKKTMPPLADKTYNLFSQFYMNVTKAAKAEEKKKKEDKKKGGDEKPASPTTASPTTAAPTEGAAAAAEEVSMVDAAGAKKAAKAEAKTAAAAGKSSQIQSTEEEKENPVDILARQLANGTYNVDAAATTVFRLKTEYNLKEANALRLVIRASVQQAEKNATEGTIPRFVDALRTNLELLKRFVDKKEESQKIVIREVQLLCHKNKCPERFMMAVKLLVEEEVVTDSEVFSWYEGKTKDVPEDFSKDVKSRCAPFIEWLKA